MDDYIIEKRKKLEFSVEIENLAENAYDANFYLEISDLIDYNSISKVAQPISG